MKKCVGLLLGMAMMAAVAQGREVRFPGFPKGALSCEDTARSLAATLRQYTGGKVSGDCLRRKWASYDLRIRYEETQAIVVDSPTWPVFSSRAQCEGALGAEQKWWESATGVKAFLRYCSAEGMDDDLYSPRFYGLGPATGVVEVVTKSVNGQQLLSDRSVFDDMVRLSRKVGLPAVQAWISRGQLKLRFSLEADSPYVNTLYRRYDLKSTIEPYEFPDLFADADPMEFRSPAQCRTQLERAKAMLEPYWSAPVVWFCMWDGILFRAKLYHLRILTGEESFHRVTPGEDGQPFSNQYATESHCEADKARVVAHYRKLYGADRVPGALCSYRKDPYEKNPIRVFVYVKAS